MTPRRLPPALGRPPSDGWLHFIVAMTISVSVLLGVLFVGVAMLLHTTVTDQFDRIITLMAGGLLAFLQVKTGVDQITSTKIDQPADDPIPVTEKKKS